MNNNKKALDQAVQRFKAALRGCTVREGQYKIARKGATLYIVSRTPGRYYTDREYR